MKFAKLLCIFSLLSLLGCVAFPSSSYHFGFLSGAFASAALLTATTDTYRSESQVQTRGGIVFKSKNPFQYFIAHLPLWITGIILLFVMLLGTFGILG